MKIYNSPKSDLEENEWMANRPNLAYAVVLIFALEAVSAFIINLFGVFDSPATPFLSVEMGVVLVAITMILYWVWDMSIKGKKEISGLIYAVIAISVIFDGPRWLESGIFVGVTEFLTVLNLLLLLVALYLVKVKLKLWYAR